MVKSRLGTMVALAAAGAVGGVLMAPPASAVGIVGYLSNLNSGLCLTIDGGSTLNNAPAVQWKCDGDNSRYWYVYSASENRIMNYKSNKCLSPAGGSTANDAAIVQYTCDSHISRKWTITNNSDGTIRIKNNNSGKCLTIAGGSTALGARAVQYTCDGHRSRSWFYS